MREFSFKKETREKENFEKTKFEFCKNKILKIQNVA